MGEVIGTLFALFVIALIIMWVGWPVVAFAEAERLTNWEALLVFLAGSLGVFVVVATITYLSMDEAAATTYAPQPAASPSSSGTRPHSSKFTSDGLIRGHAVGGRKVAAYETHRIAGFEFTFAFVPWPGEEHRIYILKSPPYGSRASDAHSTHRHNDYSLKCHYICVDRSAYPETLTAARELALMWSQATARYIKTGKKFG